MENLIQKIGEKEFSKLELDTPFSTTCLRKNLAIIVIQKVKPASCNYKDSYILKSHVACPQLILENQTCQINKRQCGYVFKSDIFIQK